MIKPPFLSYKRTDGGLADDLETALVQLGVGPWRDVRSLGLGKPTLRSIRRAIRRETDGFLWLATCDSLKSEIICRIEIPQALRRQRWSRGRYPFVALYSGLDPYDPSIEAAIGARFSRARAAKKLRDLNGVVRNAGEDDPSFAWRAACAYQRAEIARLALSQRKVRVQIITSKTASRDADLVLDWSALLIEGWPTDEVQFQRVLAAIRCLRDSVKAAPRPVVLELTVDVRLPLAALLGWELSRARIDDVIVTQGRQNSNIEVGDDERRELGDVVENRQSLGGSGPNVIAVSSVNDLAVTSLRYADAVDARSLTTIHVLERLDSAGVAGLVAQLRDILNTLNDAGGEKHLLIRGPSSLAFWLGRNATGTGETVLPFWNQADNYDGYVTIGGAGGAGHQLRARV